MKRALKILLVLLAVVMLGMQLFRIDQTNPPVQAADTLEAAVTVPPDIGMILGRSCNDCHSHKTVFPWYANIQPSGWFLKGHIDHAKEHLNFSEFNKLDPKRKVRKLEEICDEVTNGNMPLPSYLWLHRDAVLSQTEKDALCSWTASEIQKLELIEE